MTAGLHVYLNKMCVMGISVVCSEASWPVIHGSSSFSALFDHFSEFSLSLISFLAVCKIRYSSTGKEILKIGRKMLVRKLYCFLVHKNIGLYQTEN